MSCIIAPGAKNPFGYGKKRRNGVKYLAHRLAWMDAYGEIPAGMCVCHHCDNPSCINIDHLFLGTNADNVADMVAKGRHRFGRTTPGAKLTEEMAVYAMARLLFGETQQSVADSFGVNQGAMSQIWNGKAWSRVFRGEG